MNQHFIDLHCHTIASKEKLGEPQSRNVGTKERFLSAIKKEKVSVVAITNHNYFDENQFKDFSNNDIAVIFPGIELDVKLFQGNIGHLIIVSNNQGPHYAQFLNFIKSIGADKISNACDIKLDIKSIPSLINTIDCIVVAHYGSKASAFTDEDIHFLKQSCSQYIFVEPSNLISAFIYLNKGMQSIIGSDVKDWDNYPAKNLPELKVEIENFEKLKLLLSKDSKIIKEKTDTKLFQENFQITNSTFGINEHVSLYNDCNIIMGPKSSGKSIFLEAIKSQLYNQNHSSEINYYSAENVQSEYKKLSSFVPEDSDLNKAFGTDNLLKNEIEELKKCTFPEFPDAIQQISDYLKSSAKTKLAQELGFVASSTSFSYNQNTYIQSFQSLRKDFLDISEFKNNHSYKNYVDVQETKTIDLILNKAITNILLAFKESFIEFKSLQMSNKCIKDFKIIFQELKSSSACPNTTGLLDFFNSEFSYYLHSLKLNKLINHKPWTKLDPIGNLDGKGEVKLEKVIANIITKLDVKNNFKAFKNNFVTKAKEISKSLTKVEQNIFSDDFANQITNVSILLKDNNVESIKDFFGYDSYFIRESGKMFNPSKGEQAILVLSQCLNDNSPSKNFYLLDEPEMSVGHNYVNNIIVPRIRELCRLNKCIIICTHDANIGVGTLPFQVIYREEDLNGNYHTYCGNPFSNILKDKQGNELEWRQVAIQVLEGGRDALDLREVTYGDKD